MTLSRSILLVLCGLAGVICGCGPTSVVPRLAGSWEYIETARVKSPDSLVEAVLVTGDAGATTSTITKLYLLPAGGSCDPTDEIQNKARFAGDHIKNLQVSWKSPKLLEIQYDEARIIHFHNQWYHPEVQNLRHVVELRLSPTSAEHSLPARDLF